MARLKNTAWQRYKYILNAALLALPCWFIYQSLNPQFPAQWQTQTIGEFAITPMPLDLAPPYSHHSEYVKDFYLSFNEGDVSDIRQAYLNIGHSALPINELVIGDEGIMHGTVHGQHVHAIAPQKITTNDKLWITIETWQGEQLVQKWDIPSAFSQ
ncbi:hypothetical protein [Pseudoalteromonas mariniglutinosa]|uniref:hypothetical protein n=1 Tax=Pseudoalteromonas mariniglutinosa TaxID=206042 RepID=UPI00384E98BB